MRIFVSEFICGGGCPQVTGAGSLAVEGRAMLLAIATDLAQIPGNTVVTTWNSELGPFPVPGVTGLSVESPGHEWHAFLQLAAGSDATLVIAPEIGGELTRRCRAVEALGVRLLGSNSAAVELCSDKLELADHLVRAGVATIPTAEFLPALKSDALPAGCGGAYPIIVKPRYGAGSQDIQVLSSSDQAAELLTKHDLWNRDHATDRYVCQPLLVGQPCSIAMFVDPEGNSIEILPVAEQHLSADGRLRYLGGRIPARGLDPQPIVELAEAACRSVAGLGGYVGLDVIVPLDDTSHPVLVEINPRLTTSYLGYRSLASENLAVRLLFPDKHRAPVAWQPTGCQFDAAGKLDR